MQETATIEATHPIHTQLRLVRIVGTFKLHSGLALRQLHALIALEHYSAHPAKAAEDLVQVLLSHVTRQARNMEKPANRQRSSHTQATQ